MKAGDLKEAQRLVAQRTALATIGERLVAGEALHLVLGAGDKASEIVLGDGYFKVIREDVTASIKLRVSEIDEALGRLGVEP